MRKKSRLISNGFDPYMESIYIICLGKNKIYIIWSLVGADRLAARWDRQGNWAMENLNSP